MDKVKKGLRSAAPRLVPFLVFLGLALFGYLGYPGSVEWYLSHMGLVLWVLLFLFHRIGWFVVNNQRKQAQMQPKNKTVMPKPMLPKYGKSWKEWFDLVVFIDTPKRRIANLVLTIITLAIVVMVPFGRTDGGPVSNYEQLLEGWSLQPPMGTLGIALAVGAPLLWFLVISLRNKKIGTARADKLKTIYALASSTLKYPKKRTGLTPEEQRFKDYRTSIVVKQWRGLVDPEVFFIAAPLELDTGDQEAWSKLQSNLEVKLPSDTGWHIALDEQGRGATIMPASYPMSVLWDGEQDEDPLTFLLGADLDNPGEFLRFTFSETSPHSATVGGTGSGKTSVTEAIMAQAATKPMPWSAPDDPLYAQIYVIDPKGPLANQWEGRPNLKVINGTRDIVDDDGNTITGVQAMNALVQEYYEEMNKRGQIIDSYRVAKWLDLPDEVKRKERMVPWFLVLDEYLDHTDKNSAKTDLAEIENQSRAELTEKVLLIARKGRSFGFHEMIIAQTANMTLLGAPLMRQLIARIIMGNMDMSTYQTFFGTTEVPLLPTTRISNGKKKGIPGRGRIMNAPGTAISRMQAFWFGGQENRETLDKYLPQTLDEEPTHLMAEADIDDYDVDEHGPAVDLDEDNVEEEKINETPVAPPTGANIDEVDVDELFGPSTTPEVEEEEPVSKETCYVEDCKNQGLPCANPKCENENYVCSIHAQSPDGVIKVCRECAKKHILTKLKMVGIYKHAMSKAEKVSGSSVSYTKTGNSVTIYVKVDSVELVKIMASPTQVRAMNGTDIVNTPDAIKSMITNALK